MSYQIPKAPVAKSTVQLPHWSCGEMRGAWSWNLAVTDRSELGGAGGERKVCLLLFNGNDLPPAVARERETLRFWRQRK